MALFILFGTHSSLIDFACLHFRYTSVHWSLPSSSILSQDNY